MAITFTQEKKKQRYLMLILAVVIILILFVVWWGFLREAEEFVPVITGFTPKQIQINWSVLQQEELENLKAFEGIAEFEDEVGRENPFLPY